MFSLWSDLLPLILVNAALPLQTVITLMLVRSSLRAAFAWVAGMIVVRLLQGLLFGVVLEAGGAPPDAGPQYFLGALLLVLALLLLVKGARTAMGMVDEDAPPPQWKTKVNSMSAPAAFWAGAGFMTISVKFLVFTLAAISILAEAHNAINLQVVLAFVLFVLLATSVPLVILALAASSSGGAASILERLGAWLQGNNRAITIVLSFVFGVWFLLKAAARLGIL